MIEKYRLTINPALGANVKCKVFTYHSLSDLLVAEESMASLLLFLQGEVELMHDWSNIFISEAWSDLDQEWVDITDEDLKGS